MPIWLTDKGDRVRESRQCLSIPTRGQGRKFSVGHQSISQECDDREQAEQNGAGVRDGQVGPLPLGLEADMSADFLEGHLDLPALDKPSQNLMGGLRGIGTQQRQRSKAGERIAKSEPSE